MARAARTLHPWCTAAARAVPQPCSGASLSPRAAACTCALGSTPPWLEVWYLVEAVALDAAPGEVCDTRVVRARYEADAAQHQQRGCCGSGQRGRQVWDGRNGALRKGAAHAAWPVTHAGAAHARRACAASTNPAPLPSPGCVYQMYSPPASMLKPATNRNTARATFLMALAMDVLRGRLGAHDRACGAFVRMRATRRGGSRAAPRAGTTTEAERDARVARPWATPRTCCGGPGRRR